MDTSDLTPMSFPEDDDSESRRSGGLAAGIAVAALAAGVLTVLVLDGTDRITADKPQDCVTVADADARLTCYDDSVHRAAPQPARGALAPSSSK